MQTTSGALFRLRHTSTLSESFAGRNGAGKSSVFDVIRLIRQLGSGNSYLGGSGERDVPALEFTNWLDTKIQEFEISVEADEHVFEYRLHLEQVAGDLKPRIVRERAICDKRPLFDRDLEGVRFPTGTGNATGFPLDWRQAALGAIEPTGSRREIQILHKAVSRLLILRPTPQGHGERKQRRSNSSNSRSE